MGYLKSVGTVIIYVSFFLAVITFLPGLPPEAEYSEYRYDIYFIIMQLSNMYNKPWFFIMCISSIKFPSDVQLKYETKTRLQEPEILFSGDIKGP